MDRDTCEACRYSDLDEFGFGCCHRRAPTFQSRGSWPSVSAADWCGEYGMDSDKVEKARKLERATELKRDLGDRRDSDGLDRMDAEDEVVCSVTGNHFHRWERDDLKGVNVCQDCRVPARFPKAS